MEAPKYKHYGKPRFTQWLIENPPHISEVPWIQAKLDAYMAHLEHGIQACNDKDNMKLKLHFIEAMLHPDLRDKFFV